MTDLLRKAATILRERAGASSPGPWWTDGHTVRGDSDGRTVATGGANRAHADYIATTHPLVGFALADWLDVEAYHIESHDCAAHCEPDGCERGEKAHTLARLIVGEPDA